MNLHTKLSDVRGVGAKTAATLADGGLTTVGELIDFLPRKYEDFSRVVPIADIYPGKMTVKARVASINVRRLRGRSSLTTAVLDDGTGRIQAVWFNQPYRAAQFGSDEFYFSGDFELKYGKYQLTNPSAEKVKDLPVQTGRVLPIYPTRKGLKANVTRKILDELRPLISILPEFLPPEIIEKCDLKSVSEALTLIHFPDNLTDFEKARERLAFDEIFEMVLAARLNKQENMKLKGVKIDFNQPKIKEFVDSLPFTMTGAQKRALWEILQDLAGVSSEDSAAISPMNRLLQGDVGAGKTVVAGVAAYQAHLGGFQTALAAPTAILAAQHAATLSNLLEPYGVKIALLTGAVKGKKREILLKSLKNGDIDVLVGTHALFEDPVKFHKLGFVVIDEQHRFGVKQRNKLLAKSGADGSIMPHLLAMTATPIPRSLQLTLFGDLDISVLDELPTARKPITTKIWRASTRDELYDFIRDELKQGRQSYFVAPLIEDDPVDKEAKSVAAVYKTLTKNFPKWRIGVMHGKMAADEKDSVMTEFKAGKIDILVSTTVIEVGVDVPNATIMCVENAERFGLSQLHQLRGRVGRGEHQSYCFILPSDIEKVSRRLRYIEESTDGFYLAEKDLELRGPGEIYGVAQHGDLNLQIANLADTKLIKKASSAADWFIAHKSLADFPTLRQRVERSQKLTTLN
ncbi:MAG: ATP-dependent DNA helicase RecG [Candidatus Nomurabacteria bacterium]|jgi:ATP-dependent DNA helicase RecG|nr:ATP-dependent DNA helicase RecG [Candidatus Nomurabacteria bacterium]